MPKTKEDLLKSKAIRENVINKYGEVLTSVWEMDYSIGKSITEYGRKQHEVALGRHKKMSYDKNLHEYFSMSSQNVRGKNGGLSTFPPALVKRVLEYYTEKGEIVLDPSAGHNSRMEATFLLERNYIGYDVSKPFMDFNREIATKLLNNPFGFKGGITIELIEHTSEYLDQNDNSMDLVFTSPPYWRIEDYGDEPDQLGKSETYEEFLDRLKSCISEGHRVLKPGKFCVINVNDFRYNNEFYPYHSDIISLYRDVGLKLWDVIIIKWKSAIGAAFASQVEDRKVTAKAHEYLIVGRKEGWVKENSKEVIVNTKENIWSELERR